MKDTTNELKLICNRISSLIESNNMSYGELSRLTDIPKSALHRYATGETLKIPLNRIERIANVFGVSAAWIMGWSEEDSKSNVNFSPATDDDIKFALFGGEEEITDEMYDEVKNFAEYVKQKYKNKKE